MISQGLNDKEQGLQLREKFRVLIDVMRYVQSVMISIKDSDINFTVLVPVVRCSFYVQSQCGYTDFFVFNYSVNFEGLVLFQHQLKPIKNVFNVVGVFISDHLVKRNQKNVNITVPVPQAGFE
jgi:hypothetical protein